MELHIEQGPVLDMANKPIGVVSGISGPLWWTVKLKGMAGHAGSVPMPIRKDAMVGAAEIIVALNDIGYVGPLSVEWEDSRMDRVHGATESAAFCKKLDFKPSNLAFDAAFEKAK